MASKGYTVTITVHVRWWLRLYLAGVLLMCRLTCMPPDMTKVRWYVHHGVKLRMRMH